MSRLLHSEHPIVINSELARIVGLNEAIVMQQLNYWIKGTVSGVEKDGMRWIYNSHAEWVKQFPFWSVDTVKRTFSSLKKQNLVLVEQLSKDRHNRTNYYTINILRLAEIEAETRVNIDQGILPSCNSAVCPDHEGILPPSKRAACPVVHTEITTETTPEIIPAEAKATAAQKSVAVIKPMVIEAGGKQFEIPGELKYPGAGTKSHRTWINYAIRYNNRYGTWPLWNRMTAGVVTSFIGRVGEEVAPRVAAFYLTVNDAYVVKQMHPFRLLLSGAETYHTQYVTNTSMTGTRARQIDQTQSNFDAVDEAMKLLEAREVKHANA